MDREAGSSDRRNDEQRNTVDRDGERKKEEKEKRTPQMRETEKWLDERALGLVSSGIVREIWLKEKGKIGRVDAGNASATADLGVIPKAQPRRTDGPFILAHSYCCFASSLKFWAEDFSPQIKIYK